MRTVFVDASYWIAAFNPNDNLHDVAKSARNSLIGAEFVTTHEVIGEFLTHFSRSHERVKRDCLQYTKRILNDPNITVVPQTAESFERGLRRYEEYLDSSCSLQDCISMVTMNSLNISEVLTYDKDFERMGFTALMRQWT